MTQPSATAVFASGCFWGVQYYFNQLKGVLSTRVGYAGGDVDSPTYEQVCSKRTGHYEAIEVTYDPSLVSYEELVKYFFETHDFTQENGQGPDIGPQYRSAIFCANAEERAVAERVVKLLTDKGYRVATQLLEAAPFWSAEEYHQNYYAKNGHSPYCHRYNKIF